MRSASRHFPVLRRRLAFAIPRSGVHPKRLKLRENGNPTSHSESSWGARNVSAVQMILFLALHVPLAIAMQRFTPLATIHALICCVGGIACALAGARPERVIGIAAYIAASEVLWRTTQAHVFYEGGKYAIATVFLASMFRLRLWRIYWPAVAYFLLLLPSIGISIAETDLQFARGLISFNLSGPLVLATSILYFTQTRVAPPALVRVLGIMLGPLIGLAAVCSIATFGSDDVSFDSTESNFQTSAGFGPNQVSCVLGWAIVCSFLWANLQRKSLASAGIALGLILYSAMQAALTFSRSGVWMGAIGVATAAFFLARDRRALITTATVAVFALLLAWLFILPALDRFTGGQVSNRFTEEGFSNRETIASQDLILFVEHPWLGIGPGMGKYWRGQRFGGGGVAHTEFTRLPSEHGILGVLAAIILVGMAARQVASPGAPQAKALQVTALAYSLAFMAAAAMRVALPGFVIGLAFAVPATQRGHRQPPATLPTTQMADRSRGLRGLRDKIRSAGRVPDPSRQ